MTPGGWRRRSKRSGMKPGDRIATLAMNHSHHLTAWYGAIGMGGVLHTINPRLFEDQLEYIANHAEDRVLLYDHAFAPLVEKMKPKWTTIEHYVCFDPPAGQTRLSPNGSRRYDGDYDWFEGDERDPCGLCYTSGTTGNPKGVLYEHRSTMLHTLAEASPDIFNLSKRAVVLPIVPMFHANAWGVPWAAPMAGCKLVLSADYRPDRMCQLFREERVTHSAGRADHLADHDRAYRAHRRGAGRPEAGHDRRLGRAAGDDPMVPRARDRGRPCLGHDGNVADRHLRRPAAGLGRFRPGRQGSTISLARAACLSASSFAPSTTTAMSCRATGSHRAGCRRAGPG